MRRAPRHLLPASRPAATLLEVLVVLVLLALGLAIVSPVLAPRAEARADAIAPIRARASRLGRVLDTTIDGRPLRFTPGGACLPTGPAEGTARWDPVHCRVAVTP